MTDFAEVKFFENRANGQSKGFCVISLGSEQSMRICMERLPKKELHGQNPVVTFPTKQALNQVCIIVHYNTNKKKKAVAMYANSMLLSATSRVIGTLGTYARQFFFMCSQFESQCKTRPAPAPQQSQSQRPHNPHQHQPPMPPHQQHPQHPQHPQHSQQNHGPRMMMGPPQGVRPQRMPPPGMGPPGPGGPGQQPRMHGPPLGPGPGPHHALPGHPNQGPPPGYQQGPWNGPRPNGPPGPPRGPSGPGGPPQQGPPGPGPGQHRPPGMVCIIGRSFNISR